MGHGKKPVNLSLPTDLVTEARSLTANLSETVELLLGEFVAREQALRSDREARMDAAFTQLIEHHDMHGLAGEEFLPV